VPGLPPSPRDNHRRPARQCDERDAEAFLVIENGRPSAPRYHRPNRVAKATADGYTLLLMHSPGHRPALYAKLPGRTGPAISQPSGFVTAVNLPMILWRPA